MSGKVVDLTGQIFGRLTAISRTDIIKGGKKLWACKCKCGNMVNVAPNNLKNGHTQSCGCLKSDFLIDLTGKKFGKLTVIERTDNYKDGKVRWLCKCECGNYIKIDSYSLQVKRRHCGCSIEYKLKNNLKGKRFGRLIVIERDCDNDKNDVHWLCKCDCGNIKSIRSNSLIFGLTISCGCYHREISSKINFIHGCSGAPEYTTWIHMKSRCYNKNNIRYSYYGGRGIKVCDRWLEPNGQGFLNFLEDMGKRPDGMTLDRINNDGNYEPENCRWATIKQQNRNNRSKHYITIDNETMCLTEWCEVCNINHERVRSRIRSGWTPEEALELVPRKKKGKNK